MAIKEGKVKYAWITTPNTKFQPTYTVNLEISEEEYNEYKSKGFPTKQDEDGFYMIIRRKVDGPNGMKRSAPRLFDMDKNEVDVQIGNGSTVRAQFNPYTGENQYGNYAGFDLQAIQIVDLIAGRSQDGDELLSGGEEF
jgi:hypothetical protein